MEFPRRGSLITPSHLHFGQRTAHTSTSFKMESETLAEVLNRREKATQELASYLKDSVGDVLSRGLAATVMAQPEGTFLPLAFLPPSIGTRT